MMKTQELSLKKLRIASPCSMGWQAMSGDDRMRHCNACKLNVYSTDAMTRKELEDLIFRTEGRTCLRLHRRADGTVLTKDCPVGLRGYQKRIAKFAGATLAAIIGLFSVSFGQKDEKKVIDASKIKIERTSIAAESSELTGTVTDEMGAVIPGAVVKLITKDGKKREATSNSEGVYRFEHALPSADYLLEVSSAGFTTGKVKNLEIRRNERAMLNVTLKVDGEAVLIGVVADSEPVVDMSSSEIKTTITRRKLESIPYQK